MADDIETPDQRATRERLERVAKSRTDLAARHAADPASVDRLNSRMARLSAAAKRERERFDHLVLGKARPKAPTGKRARKGKGQPVRLSPGVEERVALREEWSHKAKGTPETWDNAARTHQGALAQLHLNGSIDAEQLEWADQIGRAAESIENDVDVRTASLEARVDQSRSTAQAEQRLAIVQRHRAYTRWRALLPSPKRLVLDMIVGEPIGFSVAAKRHRVHHRKAKRELIAAIDRWPECVAWAHSTATQQDVDEINQRLVG